MNWLYENVKKLSRELWAWVTDSVATIAALFVGVAKAVIQEILDRLGDGAVDVWAYLKTVIGRLFPFAHNNAVDSLRAEINRAGLLYEDVQSILDNAGLLEMTFQGLLEFTHSLGLAGKSSKIEYAPLLGLMQRQANSRFPVNIHDVQTLQRLRRLDTIGRLDYISDMGMLGFNSDRAEQLFTATESALPLDAVRALYLRGEIPSDADSGVPLAFQWDSPGDNPKTAITLETALAKLGYGFGASEAIEKVLWDIPGVNDLIRFAVREAFDDDYSTRYGTDNEFPPAVAEWGAKQGLSRFWTERYWRSHWELPSIQLGFEMLHRRVIDKTELDDLLYALDIMPWWRDKLTKVSYSPFTRVDVRRMHNLGILDDDEVHSAYMDIGYDADRAESLLQFTKADNADTTRQASKADILRWYRVRMISRSDAETYLAETGFDADTAEYMLNYEDLRRVMEVREKEIGAVERQYKKRVLDAVQTRDTLYRLGLDTAEVNYYLTLWTPDVVGDSEATRAPAAPEPKTPTMAELRKMVTAELLTVEEWETEMLDRDYLDTDVARLRALYFPESLKEETAG